MAAETGEKPKVANPDEAGHEVIVPSAVGSEGRRRVMVGLLPGEREHHPRPQRVAADPETSDLGDFLNLCQSASFLAKQRTEDRWSTITAYLKIKHG